MVLSVQHAVIHPTCLLGIYFSVLYFIKFAFLSSNQSLINRFKPVFGRHPVYHLRCRGSLVPQQCSTSADPKRVVGREINNINLEN